jgi:hypothetical protein
MHIIYGCYGGAHSSPVAAAIHLGLLDRTRLPADSELMNLKLFDRRVAESQGCLTYLGTDSRGHKIHVLGRGPNGVIVERAIKSALFNLAGWSREEVKFVDTLITVNLPMRIGGFLSRSLGFTAIGRPIVIHGTKKAFFNIVKLVEKVERNLDDGWTEEMGVCKENTCGIGQH